MNLNKVSTSDLEAELNRRKEEARFKTERAHPALSTPNPVSWDISVGGDEMYTDYEVIVNFSTKVRDDKRYFVPFSTRSTEELRAYINRHKDFFTKVPKEHPQSWTNRLTGI
jgi:hypothetical protein